jgi:hypothetical protein
MVGFADIRPQSAAISMETKQIEIRTFWRADRCTLP